MKRARPAEEGIDAVLEEAEARAKRARADGTSSSSSSSAVADVLDMQEMLEEIFINAGVSPPALIGNYTVALGRRGQQPEMIRRISSLWFSACRYMFRRKFERKFPAHKDQPYTPPFVKCVDAITTLVMRTASSFDWGNLSALDPLRHPWFDNPGRARASRLMWQNVYLLCAATTTLLHAYCSYHWPYINNVAVIANGSLTGLPGVDDVVFDKNPSISVAVPLGPPLGQTNATVVRNGRAAMARPGGGGVSPGTNGWSRARFDDPEMVYPLLVERLLEGGATRAEIPVPRHEFECPVRPDARLRVVVHTGLGSIAGTVDVATLCASDKDGMPCVMYLQDGGDDEEAGGGPVAVLRLWSPVPAQWPPPTLQLALGLTKTISWVNATATIHANGVNLFAGMLADLEFVDVWAMYRRGPRRRPMLRRSDLYESFPSESRREFLRVLFESDRIFAETPRTTELVALDNADDYCDFYLQLADEEDDFPSCLPLLADLLRRTEPLVLYPGETKRYRATYEAHKDDD